jgi:alkylation response protein AidB-like acyl-CoA dehydrogenase
MDALLRCLLDSSSEPPPADSLAAWWAATAERRAAWATPIERAFVGGACADRLGFAFASGYAEALRALVPGLTGIAALCATEEGGNHPRAIRTALTPAPAGGFTLTGRKQWATIASEASELLVVASTGTDAAGKNRLRVVRVPTSAPGVRLQVTTAPFVPEIPHAIVELDQVAVSEADLLPGDGYDVYLKPFRTVEDLHVHAALLGYLIGVARRHALPRGMIEQLGVLAVATRALAGEPHTATLFVTLAGLFELVGRVIGELETAWAAAPDDEWRRWQRDRGLLQVAGKARAARRERAWAELAGVR